MSACVARVMLLLLLGSGPSWACGPSRSGQRVRTGRKLSPLVFNQQVPNAAENTLGASGLAEGRIVRNDSRFSELVPNYNPDIIFRDDEGTGVDRLMTTRLNEKVNTLAITVMNQWPGVKLRVTEAWEEDGFNNRDTLHYEGRAVDITTSDRERSKLGMLARLAVEAGFDWVNYESKSHIHCSVKSEKSHSKGGGCFTANTAVQTSDGRQVPLSELQVGQKILTVDTQTGQTQYSEVLLWLDRNPEEMRYFVEITTKGGRRLAVTPTHLLLMRRANETLAVYAGNVQQGDELLGLDSSGDGTLASDVVEFVGSRKQRGVYAPLTATGTLVVNGVGASCYAVINSQPVAHMAFAPYRLINNAGHAIRALLSSLTGSVARTAPAPQVGVHWYASTLYWVAQRVLPQGMLF